MDRRKLLTKKPILIITKNERNDSFDVELGGNTDSDQAFASIVFAVETIAEALDIPVDSAWNMLEMYHKARTKK